MKPLLPEFFEFWDKEWDEYKKLLVGREDFQSLAHLVSSREKLGKWLDEDTKLPKLDEVLSLLQYVLSFHSLKDFGVVGRELQQLHEKWVAISSPDLSMEELSRAGTRQQNVHDLNDLPAVVESNDGTPMDTEECVEAKA